MVKPVGRYARRYQTSTPYACDGDDINSPLEIKEVPPAAQSLVLIMDDPDAPGQTWVHWTVWNISPNTTEIAENNVPAGAVEGVTSFGRPGYGGPCPPASPKLQRGEPSGTHRYFFKLYALDTALNLESRNRVEKINEAIKGHILSQTELVGLYSRIK